MRNSALGDVPSPGKDPERDTSLVLTDVTVAHRGTKVFTGLNLSLPAGAGVAVVGPSGSGKSTLLHAVAGLVPLSAGSVEHAGVVVSGLSDRARRAWRLGSCGMVFQFGELVPELTLLENAELPLRLAGVDRREARRSVGELLERVGLSPVAGRLPSQVSGGQAQRAAIVRALAHRPALVLADEPTGALDEENSAIVVQLLLDLSTEQGANLIVVTHDRSVWERFDRVLRLSDGRLVE